MTRHELLSKAPEQLLSMLAVAGGWLRVWSGENAGRYIPPTSIGLREEDARTISLRDADFVSATRATVASPSRYNREISILLDHMTQLSDAESVIYSALATLMAVYTVDDNDALGFTTLRSLSRVIAQAVYDSERTPVLAGHSDVIPDEEEI